MLKCAARFANNKALHISRHMYQRHGIFFNKKLKARFPVFKSKHGKQSSYHPNGKVFTHAIQLPKIPPIRARIHREIIGKVSSITITRNATGYDLGLSHDLPVISGMRDGLD